MKVVVSSLTILIWRAVLCWVVDGWECRDPLGQRRAGGLWLRIWCSLHGVRTGIDEQRHTRLTHTSSSIVQVHHQPVIKLGLRQLRKTPHYLWLPGESGKILRAGLNTLVSRKYIKETNQIALWCQFVNINDFSLKRQRLRGGVTKNLGTFLIMASGNVRRKVNS